LGNDQNICKGIDRREAGAREHTAHDEIHVEISRARSLG